MVQHAQSISARSRCSPDEPAVVVVGVLGAIVKDVCLPDAMGRCDIRDDVLLVAVAEKVESKSGSNKDSRRAYKGAN